MLVVIIFIVVLIFGFSVLLFIRHKKLTEEFEKRIDFFLGQISIFFKEYSDCLQHYVSEPEESAIISKWHDLYSEISRHHLSKEHKAFNEITQFKTTYKNLQKSISESNAEIKRKEALKSLSGQISVFFADLSEITNQYVTHLIETSFYDKWNGLALQLNNIIVHKNDVEYQEIEQFKAVYGSFHDYINDANESFIRSESIKHNSLFSNIDGKSLDEQQRAAVITDEDRILVLAGAGSGKTLTISAKVKYLCEIKNVNPQDILLVSFTKKSAQEMTDRIQNKLGINVEATTFHKLGLDIIKNADGFRPDVSDEDELSRFVHSFSKMNY